MVQIGDVVTYVDERAQIRPALVQHVHNQDYINVVVVSDDASKEDSYGRQVEHATSVGRLVEFNKAGRHFVER